MGKHCFFLYGFTVLVAVFAAQVRSSPPEMDQETTSTIEVTQQTAEGTQQTLRGELVLEAQDGSLLVEDNQQLLHVVPGESITHREIFNDEYLLTPKQLGQ